jgi:hypothetical protein
VWRLCGGAKGALGADMEAADKRGHTALMKAAGYGQVLPPSPLAAAAAGGGGAAVACAGG